MCLRGFQPPKPTQLSKLAHSEMIVSAPRRCSPLASECAIGSEQMMKQRQERKLKITDGSCFSFGLPMHAQVLSLFVRITGEMKTSSVKSSPPRTARPVQVDMYVCVCGRFRGLDYPRVRPFCLLRPSAPGLHHGRRGGAPAPLFQLYVHYVAPCRASLYNTRLQRDVMVRYAQAIRN